jgi:hypothetical protein
MYLWNVRKNYFARGAGSQRRGEGGGVGGGQYKKVNKFCVFFLFFFCFNFLNCFINLKMMICYMISNDNIHNVHVCRTINTTVLKDFKIFTDCPVGRTNWLNSGPIEIAWSRHLVPPISLSRPVTPRLSRLLVYPHFKFLSRPASESPLCFGPKFGLQTPQLQS